MPSPIPAIQRALALLLFPILVASCGRSVSSPGGGSHVSREGSASASTAGLENQVVITLAPGVDAAQLAADYGASALQLESAERAVSVIPNEGQLPATLLTLLATDPRVVTSELNTWLETPEARQQSFAFDDGIGTPQTFSEQPAALAIHVAAAHEVATGVGVTVAILDTGVDPRHPLLYGSLAPGRDFIGDDDDPTDVRDLIDNDGDGRVDEAYGHGTHVAGIVHLVAPDARLMIVRVLDADGRGSLLCVAAGVRWAVEHGAKVINLSLGSMSRSDALQCALEEAEERGVVVIASAGNLGSDTQAEFPARSSHVAAIAAVDASARAAEFSSYGRIVALAAPGVGVRSTYPGGGFRLWSGTSMSAPFVTGTVALLAENHPTWRLDQMIQRIGSTAMEIHGDGDDFGAGALDIGAAIAADRRSHVDDAPVPEVLRPH